MPVAEVYTPIFTDATPLPCLIYACRLSRWLFAMLADAAISLIIAYDAATYAITLLIFSLAMQRRCRCSPRRHAMMLFRAATIRCCLLFSITDAHYHFALLYCFDMFFFRFSRMLITIPLIFSPHAMLISRLLFHSPLFDIADTPLIIFR